MKRLMFTVVCSCMLAGCVTQQVAIPNNTYDFFAEDIVSKTRKGIDNVERFYAFFNNVENGKRDQVRIVEQTIEGKPIYVDVRYSNSKIDLKMDRSNDTYSDKKIVTTTCNQLNAIEVERRTDYYVSDCSDKEQHIIFSDY
ncbi:DUF4362 domain-containing protein [Metasolibacillus meyeri]|uniref:DUF4362 domain-containing protein n=1 Tax=Metasolibacillus meyeri TaxID=1071052 RepID=UPI000D31FA2A|nr:DUF4362 domain-containing protein [Metasolibacillus meyeri]